MRRPGRVRRGLSRMIEELEELKGEGDDLGAESPAGDGAVAVLNELADDETGGRARVFGVFHA